MGGWTTEEIFQQAAGFRAAASRFFARDGHLYPAAFIFGNRPKSIEIVSPPQGSEGTPKDKEAFAVAIEVVARACGATAIATAMEAWTLEVDRAEYERNRRGVGPLEQHPERREVLYFLLESHRAGTRSWRAAIHRQGDRAIAESWQEEKPKQVGGRFSHLLDVSS
jgi:hypothetical protein